MEKRDIKALSCAKINLSLNVCGRSVNGMHLLDSVTTSVDLADVVTVSSSRETKVSYDGRESAYENDAVLRALNYLKTAYRDFDIAVRVEKRLPERAGVGGSSADAAAAIVLACEILGIDAKKLDLADVALKVGSDVPYMMFGGYARLKGEGGELRFFRGAPLDFLLCYGGDGVPTKECFARFDELCGGEKTVCDNGELTDALISGDKGKVMRLCGNALQDAACSLCVDIEKRLIALKRLGAGAAFMTGSGSACVGIFESKERAIEAEEKWKKEFSALGRAKAVSGVPSGIVRQ